MEDGEKGKDRYFPRIVADVTFSYRPKGAPVSEGAITRTKTFGLGGFMFEDECPLPVGSDLTIDLVLGENRMELDGKVVYSNRMGADRFQNGVSFTPLSEDDRDRLTSFFLLEYEKKPSDM